MTRADGRATDDTTIRPNPKSTKQPDGVSPATSPRVGPTPSATPAPEHAPGGARTEKNSGARSECYSQPLALVLGLGGGAAGAGVRLPDRRPPRPDPSRRPARGDDVVGVDAVGRGHRPGGCWARRRGRVPVLPRWQLLALGMVLFLGAGVGAGWVAETVITAPGAGGGLGADQRVQPGPAAAPHPPRGARRGDGHGGRRRHVRGLLPVHRPGPGPTGGRLGRPRLPGRGGGLALPGHPASRLHDLRRTRRRHHHDQSGPRERHRHRLRPDLELPIDGLHPAAGPTSPGRMALRRVLGQGYRITDYRPC